MRKSLLTLLAILFITAIALVGCGGGSDEDVESEDSGTETADEADTSETDEAEEADEGESVEWVANAVYPEGNHTADALIELADKVEEATDGKVHLDVMAGGALGYEGPELLTAVRDNAVPVSDILTSGVAGDEPLFELVTLPFLVQSFEEGEILKDISRPYFDEVAQEKWNQKILYIVPWPIAGFWTQNKIESVDDMQGLKMRTYDKNGALVVEAGGGTPHPLPFSEVYSSLSTGVIDSVLTSSPTAVDAKFWEVLDYFSPVNVTMATSFVSVNLDEFNKLDEATQEAVLQAAQEIEDKVWGEVPQLDADQVAISNENGIETVEPTEEFMQDLTDMTEDIRAEWLETAPEEAQEILDQFYEEVGR